MKIILASSSPYRKKLLNTLLPSLTCIAPNINESLHEGESPAKNVTRLSFEKAKAVSHQLGNALIYWFRSMCRTKWEYNL